MTIRQNPQPPLRRAAPPPPRSHPPRPAPREPSQVIRRDQHYRPPLPPPPPPPLPQHPQPQRLQRRPPPSRPFLQNHREEPVRAAEMLQTPRKPRRARAVAITFLVALLAFAGIGLWIDQTLDREPVLADYPGRPAAGKGSTWLIVGSDNRDDLPPEEQVELATGGDMDSARTDTILLVHVPALGASRPTAIVSIPRDSYVRVPGYGQDKINSAFSIGGPRLLVQAVEGATGLRVDHYAELGFGGFAKIVDAMGGVTMCLSEPMDDPLAGINLDAGCQTLDGRNALGFVRSRATPAADLDRMVHQREFMAAMLHRATDPRVSLNPARWIGLEQSVTDALTVDNGAHVWDLARLAYALRGKTVALTVPIAGFVNNDAGDVVSWDSEAASRLFEAMATDSALPADLVPSQQ